MCDQYIKIFLHYLKVFNSHKYDMKINTYVISTYNMNSKFSWTDKNKNLKLDIEHYY